MNIRDNELLVLEQYPVSAGQTVNELKKWKLEVFKTITFASPWNM